MIFGLIIILISVSSLQTNENSQVLKLEVKPVYNLWTGLHKYICRFNETVNCLWQNGGSAISISKYQYKYIDENGNETSDCSIIGSKNDSRKMPDSLKCIGLTTQILITAEINDVIELNCETIKRNKCSWKRNNQIVNVDQRYEYTEDQGEKITAICSIRIRQVQLLDEGNWTCGNQADDSNNAILTKRYFIRVINHSTSDKEPSIDNDSKVDKVTISSEKEITLINSPLTTTTSKADRIGLIAGLCAASLVAVVLIIFVAYLYKSYIKGLKVKPSSDECKKPEEPTYVNVINSSDAEVVQSQPESQTLLSNQPEPPISTSTPCLSRSIAADNDNHEETEVIYTQVVISKQNSVDYPVPHKTVEKTIYATIMEKRVSGNFSNKDSAIE
ncbi:hypothetical protein CHUAL_003583 [Chamberlinius hualienensis]